MSFDSAFVLELFFIRSALILLAGLVLGQLLRSRYPATAKLTLRVCLALSVFCVCIPTSLRQSSAPILLVDTPVEQPQIATEQPSAALEQLNSKTRQGRGIASSPVWVSESSNLSAHAPVAAVGRPTIEISLINIWAFGVGVCFFINCIGVAGLYALAKGSVPVNDPVLNDALEREVQKLKTRRPQLRTTGPACRVSVAGVRNPTLFVPTELLSSAEPTALAAILKHELLHIRNEDCLWNLVSRFAVSVLWFNPMIWLTTRLLKGVTEELCDLGVIETGVSPKTYAASLLWVANAMGHNGKLIRLEMGISERHSRLGVRVAKILNESWTGGSRLRLRVRFAVGIFGLAAVVAGGCVVSGNSSEATRAVRRHHSPTSWFRFFPGDPKAAALLENAMNVHRHPGSLRETIFFYYPDGSKESFQVSRVSDEGPGKVEVLAPARGPYGSAFTSPEGDYLVQTAPRNSASLIKVTPDSSHGFVHDPYGDDEGLKLALTIAGSKLSRGMDDMHGRFHAWNAVFRPDSICQGREAWTVNMHYPGDSTIWHYLIDKATGLLVETDRTNPVNGQLEKVDHFSNISYNGHVDVEKVKFKPSAGVPLNVFTPLLLSRPPTSLEQKVSEAISHMEGLRFVDYQYLRNEKQKQPEVGELGKPSRILTATVQRSECVAVMVNCARPGETVRIWSDDSYLWAQRQGQPKKYLKSAKDSDNRRLFGGLARLQDCPAGRNFLGFPFDALMREGPVRTSSETIRGTPVYCLKYDNQTIYADAKTFVVRRVITRLRAKGGGSDPVDSVEDFEIEPLREHLADSAFAFHPIPGTVEVGTADELR